MIPRIIKYKLVKTNSKNILRSFINDPSYHILGNKFSISKITIGPFDKETNLSVSLSNYYEVICTYKLEDMVESFDKGNSIYHFAVLVSI